LPFVVSDSLPALRNSVDRLATIVSRLDDTAIETSAYPAEWTVAQTMSHLGSGAVIFLAVVGDTALRHALIDAAVVLAQVGV
jgi:hypothetical protein